MIDVQSANNRAADLRSQKEQLNTAIRYLNEFENGITASWSGKEVPYYIQAIERIKTRIQLLCNQIDGAAGNVSGTAATIRAEEEAAEAERKRKEEEERKAKEEAEAAATAAASISTVTALNIANTVSTVTKSSSSKNTKKKK